MLLAKNRKALFNNEVLDKYLAGIKLKGYEVKAIREGKVSFEGAFVSVADDEVYVNNLNIGKYSKQNQEFNEELARAPRKLLLNAHEISKIKKEIAEKGKTAIPLALLLGNNKIKLEFAIAKGKKKHEQKQTLKKRQIEKDLQKSIKETGF